MKYELIIYGYDGQEYPIIWHLLDNKLSIVAEFYDEQLAIKVLEFLNSQPN